MRKIVIAIDGYFCKARFLRYLRQHQLVTLEYRYKQYT